MGSVAEDEARTDSDVDILVESQGPATFNSYMDLKFFLEDLLGSHIDLVTRKSIMPGLKTQIEREGLSAQRIISQGFPDTVAAVINHMVVYRYSFNRCSIKI